MARLTQTDARTAFLVLKTVRQWLGGPDIAQIIARPADVIVLSGGALCRLAADVDETGTRWVPLEATNSAIYNTDDDWVDTDEWPAADAEPDLTPEYAPPANWETVEPAPPYDVLADWTGTRYLGHIFHGRKVWAANEHRGLLWPHDTPVEGVLPTELCRAAHYATTKVDAPLKVGRTDEAEFMKVGPFTFRHAAFETDQHDLLPDIVDGIDADFRTTLSDWPGCDTNAKRLELGFHATVSGIHSDGDWVRIQACYLEQIMETLTLPVRISMDQPTHRYAIHFEGQTWEVALMPCKWD